MSVGFLRNTSNSFKIQDKISYLFISYNVMFMIVTYIWELLEEINTNCLCIEYTGYM